MTDPNAPTTSASGLNHSSRPEWWERARDRLTASRWFTTVIRIRAALSWLGLLALAVAVIFYPVLRTALGAWLGCMWLVVCWFALARAKTVSWALTSGVMTVSIMLAPLIALLCAHLVVAAEVSVSSTATKVVIASIVEEILKLTPLAALALVAPGRTRRMLAGDWLVLGVAAGAGFEAVEEVSRRIALLESGSGLLDALLCPQDGLESLACRGAPIYSLSPVSGAAGDAFPYAGHAIITGLVGGAIGLGIAVWRRSGRLRPGRALVARLVSVALPLWFWWVGVVDHMGHNASPYGLWSGTDEHAPWWPVGVTAALTCQGHYRGAALLILLAVTWVVDIRTLWAGGYTLMIEGDDGGGRWGLWRWRVWRAMPHRAWTRPPGNPWRSLQADLVDLLAVVAIEARWARLTLLEAAAARRPLLLARAPANLRIAREEAARAELDPQPRRWWRWRLSAATLITAGIGVILLTPGLTRDLAVALGENHLFWLAGILDALADIWESLSWEQKAGLMLLAGAIILLSGGTLGLAFNVGLGVSTVFESMRGAASLVRDPRTTVRQYLATHTPGEIAADLAMTALTTLAGGLLGAAGGQMGRGAYAAYREADYAAWLWRTDRAAWRAYAANRRDAVRRFLDEETGAGRPYQWNPRQGIHYPGLRTVRHGDSEGGPGAWGPGKNHGSARAQTYEEMVTGTPIEDSYYVGDIEFDGYDKIELIEAKGEGYSLLHRSKWGPNVIESFTEQAKKQVAAVRASGNPTPVRWEIAESDIFKRLQIAQSNGDFPKEIRLSHTPPP